MPNRRLLLFALVYVVMLGVAVETSRVQSADSLRYESTLPRTGNAIVVGVNFNDGGRLRPEFPEHIFRDASRGRWPVPAISTTDLAQGMKPVANQSDRHPLSGDIQKLTDGAGPADADDPGNCFLFDDGVRVGRFRVSLPQVEPIGEINTYSWHRNLLVGGIRAPQRIDVYASDGAAKGFDVDNPHGPGYRLLAHVDTTRPGGINAQSGQHGSCINRVNGLPLGKFRHFIFEVYPPVEALTHTFLSEVDIVRADVQTGSSVAPDVAKVRYFDKYVGPILGRRCLDCHNASDLKGGLDLSNLAGVMRGGDSGPPLVPGNPQGSHLFTRIEGDEMPPKHPLSDEEKHTLRDWIAAGATWSSDPIDRFRFSSDTRAGYDWWALQPLEQVEPPQVRDQTWPINDIDRFVLGRLEAKGLAPSPPADRRTLIRRLTFDLIGLPPTPEEMAAFVTDDAPDAYERLVDRLLASPHHGERWARHWLDVVRFAESEGFERNKFYRSAWKYRDWVIKALNDDLPYDEFIKLQIAGDTLYPNDADAITATGYLVCGPHDLLGLTQGSAAMRANTREDELEETVGNVSQTFLGLTINCARCHDHKFDPLYQREYYQLAAALGGLERSVRVIQPITAKLPDELVSAMREADKELRRELGQEGEALLQDARRERARAARESAIMALAAADVKVPPTKDEAAVNAKHKLADRQRDSYAATDELHATENPFSIAAWDQVCDKLPRKVEAAAMPWVLKLSLLEQRARLASGGPIQSFNSAPSQYFHVLGRGSFRASGQVVSPRGFECVNVPTSDWGLKPNAPEADRRVRLAAWISDPSNPLAARVVVNRLWHHHFGIGIVSTPNDFGYNGDRPSHPELLDWLATQLLRSGWSLKQVHRQIVLSTTYRQSAAYDERAAKVDAENRLLWRKAPIRLTAEDIRDAVLVVSGRLNWRMGGPSYRDLEVNTKEDNVVYRPVVAFNPAVNRRTIYRTIVRAAMPQFLETLDCADPNVATPRRSVTTTPLQALSMLNNPFMDQAAKAFASRAQSLAGDDVERQIDQIYLLAFARQPTANERDAARSYADEFGLAELCLAIFNSNEFAYVD